MRTTRRPICAHWQPSHGQGTWCPPLGLLRTIDHRPSDNTPYRGWSSGQHRSSLRQHWRQLDIDSPSSSLTPAIGTTTILTLIHADKRGSFSGASAELACHLDLSNSLRRGAEQRQIWQIVLYCDRIRCYAAEMWQKLKCYACFILPKLIKNRLTDQWYWSRIGKVAAYSVKQQNSWKKIARKTLDVAT